MELLNGKIIAEKIRAETADEVKALNVKGIHVRMAAVVASSDTSVLSYVKSKVKNAAKLGITMDVIDLGVSPSQHELEKCVERLGEDPAIHGILLELPLAPGLNQDRVLDLIPEAKDIEGLTSTNLGKIIAGREHDAFLPSTPLACIMLAEIHGRLRGKKVGIVGRGKTVGRPLVGMLLNRDATPIVCHTRSGELIDLLKGCDIIVVAVGKAKLITDKHVRAGQIIIDAGINSINNQIVGDVDAELVQSAGITALSPVPGGVGPITSVLIFKNLVTAVKRQYHQLTT